MDFKRRWSKPYILGIKDSWKQHEVRSIASKLMSLHNYNALHDRNLDGPKVPDQCQSNNRWDKSRLCYNSI